MAPHSPRQSQGGRPSGTTRVVRRRPRPSRATIIRRRLVALVILLALIALLAFGVTSLVRALTARDTPAPTSAASAQVEACRLRDVTLEVAAGDIVEGQPGDAAVTFTNEREVPCTLEAGRDHLVLRVTSGEEAVWDSRTCEAGPRNRPLLLDAGASSDIVLTWDGTHGGSECATDAPVAAPGTYRYEVSLDTLVDAARVQVHPEASEPPSPTPSLENRPSPTPGTGASPGRSSEPGDAGATEGTTTEGEASGETASDEDESAG